MHIVELHKLNQFSRQSYAFLGGMREKLQPMMRWAINRA